MVLDEETTASSVTAAALAALGVPALRDLDSQAWLESTVLFHSLLACEARPQPVTGPFVPS